MTKLFEQAVAQVSQLTAEEQDAIAQIVLEELDEEARWDASFAQSANLLAQLAQEAEQEEQAGNAKELNPDKL